MLFVTPYTDIHKLFRKDSIMKMITSFLPPEDAVMTQEATASLIEIISEVQLGILRAWKKLPPAIQGLIQEIAIEPNLRDNEPDRIKTIIKVKEKTQEERRVGIVIPETIIILYVECLDPERALKSETTFREIILVLVEQINLRLQEILQTLSIPPS